MAAVATAILGVAKEKLSENVPEGERGLRRNPSANRFKGLPAMFSPQWQAARSNLLERFGRTPTVGKVLEFLRESSQASKFAHRDSVENYELEAPAVDPSRSQPGRMNQKLCWSLKEAGERCGVSYLALYRAACRGDLKNNKGCGRMMVSESELSRFTANVTEYLPRKRGKTCGARSATPEHGND